MLSKLTTILCVLFFTQSALAVGADERREILDAIRPVASKMAGQAVRFKVDKLNVDGDWAVLVGGLMGQPGTPMDWELAAGCQPDLDRMLWVVSHRIKGTWKVKHIEICASEPPYWYMDQYGGLVWPCGVYAGLEDGAQNLEARCRQERAKPATKKGK